MDRHASVFGPASTDNALPCGQDCYTASRRAASPYLDVTGRRWRSRIEAAV